MVIKKGDRIKTTWGEIREVHGIYDANSERMVESNEGISNSKYILMIDADDADNKNFPYGFIQIGSIKEIVK